MSDAKIQYMGTETIVPSGRSAVMVSTGKTMAGDVVFYAGEGGGSVAVDYILESTGDKTDRTAEILAMLETYGVCQLGKGVFYVSNLDMPSDTTLQGFGHDSSIYLNKDVENGYAVQIGVHCTVQDLTIIGQYEGIPSSVGTRHGIIVKGDASTDNTFDVRWMPTITNCYIEGFTGGGITCHDTGYGLLHGLNVTNCKIYNCGAGINIDEWSEYHRFTNVACHSCRYGCINNGGNNVFVNCTFSQNTTGFSITGNNFSVGHANDAHGSTIGCIINHSGNNNGRAIEILGTTSGYVFQGCQVFYGSIYVNNARGVTFDGMNFGQNIPIEIYHGGLIMFTDCAFSTAPIMTTVDNKNVKMFHCYTLDGAQIGESIKFDPWKFTFADGTVDDRKVLINES